MGCSEEKNFLGNGLNYGDAAGIAESIGIKIEDFDFILFGDGSGTTISNASAWCCFIYDVKRGELLKHFGGTRSGTNNLAELMPYILGLWHINGTATTPKPRVAIISDSEVTVRCGTGQYARKANQAIWASIEWFEKQGYKLHWHHVRRNTNELNAACDEAAGRLRKQIEEFK